MTSIIDPQTIFGEGQTRIAERREESNLVNIRTSRRESVHQQQNVRLTYDHLSEKKSPSSYDNSVSLQTMEQESNHRSRNIVHTLKQRIKALQQQIQSLHQSYAIKMEQLTNQHNDRSKKYLELIHDMHMRHQQQTVHYCNIINEFEHEHSQISIIEDKMNYINGGIEDILKESAELAAKNKELIDVLEQKEGMIRERDQIIEHREMMLRKNADVLESIDGELNACRQKMIEYQQTMKDYDLIKNQWKILQQELVEMIDSANAELINNSASDEFKSKCDIGRVNRDKCQHCKINNLGRKVNETMSKLY